MPCYIMPQHKFSDADGYPDRKVYKNGIRKIRSIYKMYELETWWHNFENCPKLGFLHDTGYTEDILKRAQMQPEYDSCCLTFPYANI